MSDVFAGGEAASLSVQTGSEKPLTDQERAILQRLLSDPFSYPQQFKTWLISFLEGSDILLARSSVQGLSSLLGSGTSGGVLGLLPAGLILPYGGPVAPEGAYLCDGAFYSRTGAKRLFDAIGTQFGAGDGSTTFNVPDMRRRLPFGNGVGIGIGVNDGQAESGRHVDHHHFFIDTGTPSGVTTTDGNHHHTVGFEYRTLALGTGAAQDTVKMAGATNTSDAGSHNHGLSMNSYTTSGNTSGSYLQDRPAFLTVGWIINH